MRERRHRRRRLAEVTVWVPAEKIEAVKNYARRMGRRRALGRDDIVETLRQHRSIFDRFGVRSVALFGSMARGEAQPHSDIDLLIEFDQGRPSGLFEFVELKHALEGLLGRPVDLTTAPNIKPRLRNRILAEADVIF